MHAHYYSIDESNIVDIIKYVDAVGAIIQVSAIYSINLLFFVIFFFLYLCKSRPNSSWYRHRQIMKQTRHN